MTAFLLLQFESFGFLGKYFGSQPLERFPAALSLIYLAGAIFVALLLLLIVTLSRRKKSAFTHEADQNLPDEVRRRLGSTSANRAIWIFRFAFVILAFSVFGFHVYWTIYAAESDPHFAKLGDRDIRVRRVSASNLRGWILDRDGALTDAFAFWRIEKKIDERGKTDEDLVRQYPLEREMAHLLGTEIGSPGLERTLFTRREETTPEALEVLTNEKPPADDRDVRITIDRELQKFAFDQLKDKRGAIVVLNPQTGDVLAVASNPTFSLSDARDLDKIRQLEANLKDRPLVSRAMREYYVPGSTFKTFTMIAAYRAGKQDTNFVDTPGGYVPSRGARPITDDNGSCENCGPLQMPLAYEFSSNQFFSFMAVELGRDRLRETAQLLGIEPVDDPNDALRVGFAPELWNASSDSIKGAMAPRASSMVTGKNITAYDLAIQGMGQGYAGQMTPFQMAMIAAAAGNVNGNVMKPKIEVDRAPEVFSKILTAQQAAEVRQIMLRVATGARGTGRGMQAIVGNDVLIGGKTGTAQKQVPAFDPKTGKVKTITLKRKNKLGETVEYQKTVLEDRVDSWFISVAPIENPQIAVAVVIEGGGYGARTAGPINANMIVKARQVGLLGEALRPKTVPASATDSTTRQPRRRQR